MKKRVYLIVGMYNHNPRFTESFLAPEIPDNMQPEDVPELYDAINEYCQLARGRTTINLILLYTQNPYSYKMEYVRALTYSTDLTSDENSFPVCADDESDEASYRSVSDDSSAPELAGSSSENKSAPDDTSVSGKNSAPDHDHSVSNAKSAPERNSHGAENKSDQKRQLHNADDKPAKNHITWF